MDSESIRQEGPVTVLASHECFVVPLGIRHLVHGEHHLVPVVPTDFLRLYNFHSLLEASRLLRTLTPLLRWQLVLLYIPLLLACL